MSIMKKKFLIVAVLMTLSSALFAQNSFQNKSNDINAGVGFGGLVWKGVSYGATYERGVSNVIGVGVHFAYSQYSKGGYNYTAALFGLKGAYHFWTTNKLDPYAGAELGYISITHTGHSETSAAHSYTPVGVGIYGGVRYFLTPQFGLYGELHVSTFSVVGVGVCVKL